MNKKLVIIPIVAIALIFVFSLSLEPSEKQEKEIVFHATLADPNLYNNDDVYVKKFAIEEGEYVFRFVPNGSSPKMLSITLEGSSFNFYEDFKLIGIAHQTGISEYFTWDYDGEKAILISETQEISIIINPNGNVLGSVSVDILKN